MCAGKLGLDLKNKDVLPILRAACEKAKVELSDIEATQVLLDDGEEGKSGRVVEVTRLELENGESNSQPNVSSITLFIHTMIPSVMSNLVMSVVDTVTRLLEDINCDVASIQELVLVGGSKLL